jgi:hypothetical protein
MPVTPRAHRLSPQGQVFILQLHTISLPEWRDALEDARVELLAYFPNNSHIVRLSPEAADRVRSLDFVQRIVPYHPWYRLEHSLRSWLTDEDAHPARVRVRVMSFSWGHHAKRVIVDAASRVGAELVKNTSSGHVVELRVTRGQLQRIAANDSVM